MVTVPAPDSQELHHRLHNGLHEKVWGLGFGDEGHEGVEGAWVGPPPPPCTRNGRIGTTKLCTVVCVCVRGTMERCVRASHVKDVCTVPPGGAGVLLY